MSTDWAVYDDEVSMYDATLGLCTRGEHKLHPHPIPNAIVEALLLHTRILIDIFLSRDTDPDAVHLQKLLPGFDSPELGALRNIYGSTTVRRSPCWIISKRLAHSTAVRSDSFDYISLVNNLNDLLLPIIRKVHDERFDRAASVKPGP
jgi:hypothetical protein